MAACRRCATHNHREFPCEIAIHFPGLEGLEKPIVWVFPKALVCLSCGFTEFIVPSLELPVLAEGRAIEGALVLNQERQKIA